MVDLVLELTGRTERRRRLVPARAVVCFVLALCLFSSSDSAGPPGYRAVLRTLTDRLRHLPGGLVQRLPTGSALTRARHPTRQPGTQPAQTPEFRTHTRHKGSVSKLTDPHARSRSTARSPNRSGREPNPCRTSSDFLFRMTQRQFDVHSGEHLAMRC